MTIKKGVKNAFDGFGKVISGVFIVNENDLNFKLNLNFFVSR